MTSLQRFIISDKEAIVPTPPVDQPLELHLGRALIPFFLDDAYEHLASEGTALLNHPLSTPQHSGIAARTTHIDALWGSAGSSQWLGLFSRSFPVLEHAVIRGIGMQFDSREEPYRTISHNSDFLSLIPTLHTLEIMSVSLRWSIFNPSGSLRCLVIDYSRFSPRGQASSGPDFDPGLTVPSLAELRNILAKLQLLEVLSLAGIFEPPSPYTAASPGTISLPVLHTLSLAGNCTMNLLICSFATPALQTLRIATTAWLSIDTLPILTGYMRLYAHPAGVVATIIAGLQGNDTHESVHFDVCHSTDETPHLTLENLGGAESWEYMIYCSGANNASVLAIIDRVPARYVHPINDRALQRVMRQFKNIEELWVEGGIRWGSAVINVIAASPDIWPGIRLLEIDPASMEDKDVVAALGVWLNSLITSRRHIEVRIQGRRLTRPVVEALTADLSPALASPFFSWLEYESY